MARFLEGYRLKPSEAIHLATMEKERVAHIVSEDAEFDRVKAVKRI